LFVFFTSFQLEKDAAVSATDQYKRKIKKQKEMKEEMKKAEGETGTKIRSNSFVQTKNRFFYIVHFY
jgi:hypothetical protein